MPNTRSTAHAGSRWAAKDRAAALAVSIQEFAHDPFLVGSAFPASQWLVDATLQPLDWSRIRLIVEYGPGTGRFTRAILDRLHPRGRLVAFETGANFVRYLRNTIDDPRLVVMEAPAQDVESGIARYGAADCIVSGIPFSTLMPGEDQALFRTSCAALADHGWFVAYQMRRDVLSPLRRHFRSIRAAREWRNIPPCHIYWATEKR
jgi:phospholipid N-methyltransferase